MLVHKISERLRASTVLASSSDSRLFLTVWRHQIIMRHDEVLELWEGLNKQNRMIYERRKKTCKYAMLLATRACAPRRTELEWRETSAFDFPAPVDRLSRRRDECRRPASRTMVLCVIPWVTRIWIVERRVRTWIMRCTLRSKPVLLSMMS